MPDRTEYDFEGAGAEGTVIGWRVYHLEQAVHALEAWRNARLSEDASILELVKANTMAVRELRDNLRSLFFIALASFLSVVGEAVYQVVTRHP